MQGDGDYNFINNINSITRPFVLGRNVVERLTNYKLLGVQISVVLVWFFQFSSSLVLV